MTYTMKRHTNGRVKNLKCGAANPLRHSSTGNLSRVRVLLVMLLMLLTAVLGAV